LRWFKTGSLGERGHQKFSTVKGGRNITQKKGIRRQINGYDISSRNNKKGEKKRGGRKIDM